MDEFTRAHFYNVDDPTQNARRAHTQDILDLVTEHLKNIRSAVTVVARGMCTIDLEPIAYNQHQKSLALRGIHDLFGGLLLTASSQPLEPGSTDFSRVATLISDDLAAVYALIPPTKCAGLVRANPHYASWWVDEFPFPPPPTDAEQKRLRPAGLPPSFGTPLAPRWPSDAQQAHHRSAGLPPSC
ncbi:hypothetical protein Franean1_1337 [Parafrankia sp. EAN1pec]|uniref:hypothetical protein n=1 Tax=Parafrankia sp. (strain EAN1pec) TaxID=298653 RepID=UPI0000543873|nr:hypothetical protein Franean1_1337 [Frankia sp. EAN1pec]